MTLDDMYDEMDLYGFDDFDNSQKLVLLNEAYFDIATREPWPFMEDVIEFVVPAGVGRVTNNRVAFMESPSDVNSVLSFRDVTRGFALSPERSDIIEKNYDASASSSECYYFVGEDLFLYPASSGASKYRLYYIKSPVAATEETGSSVYLIPERHHSIIVYGALIKAFLVNDDPQAAVFQNMFEQRYQQMRNDAWMQQYDRTDRIYVLNDFD
jgi:hypothetical protein